MPRPVQAATDVPPVLVDPERQFIGLRRTPYVFNAIGTNNGGAQTAVRDATHHSVISVELDPGCANHLIALATVTLRARP